MGKKKDKKKNKKKKENIDMSIKKKVYAILTILLIVLVGAYYYAFFPAVNIHLESFWGAAIVILVALGCIFALSQLKGAWSSNVTEAFREKKMYDKTFLDTCCSCSDCLCYRLCGRS